MKEFIDLFLSAQDMPEAAGEGLPYGIFWLLILIIALLLVFIFLRDKDLRRRLDGFFQGIKRRLRKIRLQANLKRERQRHESFLLELGERAWEEDIELPTAASLRDELARLDKKITELEDKRKDYDHKISAVEKDLADFQKGQEAEHLKLEAEMKPYVDRVTELKSEEKALAHALAQTRKQMEAAEKELNNTRKTLQNMEAKDDMLQEVKEFEIKGLRDKIEDLENALQQTSELKTPQKEQRDDLNNKIAAEQKSVDAYQAKLKQNSSVTKDRTRKLSKDIQEWRKRRDKVAERIREIEEQKTPLFKSLGEQVETERIDHKELEILYTKIDRTKVKTQELEDLIKDLE